MQLTICDIPYIYVSLQGCDVVHAVITPKYYNIVIKEIYRAPPGIYEDSVYTMATSPFTFTTLNNHLPFRVAATGGLNLSITSASRKSLALVKFHQSCLDIYQQYSLSPDLLWFDYMATDEIYAAQFKETYDQFSRYRISST